MLLTTINLLQALLAVMPDPIRNLAAKSEMIELGDGEEGKQSWALCQAERTTHFLKRAAGDNEEALRLLRHEMDVLLWLDSRLPVPETVFFENGASATYLLTKGLPGTIAAKHRAGGGAESIVRSAAENLRRVHDIPVLGCPFGDGSDAGQSEDVRFIHGRYALDSILVYDGKVTGLLDWSHAKVGDRYLDLTCLWRSVVSRGWFDATSALEIIRQGYGLSLIDLRKLRFHDLSLTL